MGQGLGIQLGLGGGRSATSSGAPSGGGSIENLYSFDFDGSDEYVALGELSYLNSASVFSFSFWYNADSLGGCMFGTTTALSKAIFFQAYTDNNLYAVASNGSNSWLVGAVPVDDRTGAWNHVAFCFDGPYDSGNGSLLYFNGSLIPSLTENRPLPTAMASDVADDCRIGTWDTTEFNGHVDEVAIFNYKLSASDVAIIAGSSPALPSGEKGTVDLNAQSFTRPLHWWRMGDGATWGDVGGTDKWTIPDVGSAASNNGLSANMEEGDRVEDVP